MEKLDKRYKHYKDGFRYTVGFGLKTNFEKYLLVINWCEQIYGPTSQNKNWRIDQYSKWNRQIYLCEEAATMFALKFGAL